MKKYQLTERGLKNLSVKLVEAGLLEQSDIEQQGASKPSDSIPAAEPSPPLQSEALPERVPSDAKSRLAEEKLPPTEEGYEPSFGVSDSSRTAFFLGSSWLKMVGYVSVALIGVIVLAVLYRVVRGPDRETKPTDVQTQEALLKAQIEINRLKAVEQAKLRLDEEKQQLEQKILGLRGIEKEKNEVDAKINDLSNEIRRKEGQIAGYNETLAKNQEAMNSLQKAKGELDKEIERLKTSVNQAQQAASRIVVDDSLKKPLLEASAAGKLEQVQRLLTPRRANVDARDRDGRTPLMLASGKGSYGVAEVLLKSGADVNCRDNDGVTALMVACQYDRLEVVKLLLQRGANANLRNRNRETAHKFTRNSKILELLDQPVPRLNR